MLERFEVTVKRLDKGQFVICDLHEDKMSRRQLIVLLGKVMKYTPQQIAEMFLEFRANPEHTTAYFGMAGNLLYTKS